MTRAAIRASRLAGHRAPAYNPARRASSPTLAHVHELPHHAVGILAASRVRRRASPSLRAQQARRAARRIADMQRFAEVSDPAALARRRVDRVSRGHCRHRARSLDGRHLARALGRHTHPAHSRGTRPTSTRRASSETYRRSPSSPRAEIRTMPISCGFFRWMAARRASSRPCAMA